MSMTLDEARAVIAEHDAQRREEKRRQSEARYLGRYFKYRNNYGAGSTVAPWWLYAHVAGVDEWAHLTGTSFQDDGDGMIRIEYSKMLTIGGFSGDDLGGWIEITKSEFHDAKSQLLEAVQNKLQITA